MPTRELTVKQHAFVSAYLGEANGNATEAARIAGYKQPMQQGNRLLRNVEVADRLREWRATVQKQAITIQQYRIARLADLEQRCVSIIEERAVEMEGEVAGGGSGLLVRQKKVIRSGDDITIEYQYVVDTGLIKELRELLKQAAQEVGDWTDNKRITFDSEAVIIEVAEKYGLDPKALAAELESEE